ncbi:MAG: hypothetical protein ACK4WM_03785 [Thermoflexales bacterium]
MLDAEAVQVNQNRKLGFWLSLGPELLISAEPIGACVLMRRQVFLRDEKWRHATAFSTALVSVDTFILLASSLMVVLGLNAIRENHQRGLQRYLALTALLGSLFC